MPVTLAAPVLRGRCHDYGYHQGRWAPDSANVLLVILAPAQSLMKSFRLASVMAVQRLRELAISLEHKPMEEKKELLKKCAMTTLNSKLVGGTWQRAPGSTGRTWRGVSEFWWAAGDRRVAGGVRWRVIGVSAGRATATVGSSLWS